MKNPLTLDFIGQDAESALAKRRVKSLIFLVFLAPARCGHKAPGLQEIRAGGIMPADDDRDQAHGKDGTGMYRAARKP